MKYNIIGKNIEVTKLLEDRVVSKLGRIERLFPENTEATVTLSVIKIDQIIEVSIPLKKRILRAEVSTHDMNASIDEIVDVLEKQVVKYKSRLRTRARDNTVFNDELAANFTAFDSPEEINDAHSLQIGRTKRFALKPMDAEEAVMEMELLGHSFFVFRNGDTDEVNVVYKRKNNTYGLIEPEY